MIKLTAKRSVVALCLTVIAAIAGILAISFTEDHTPREADLAKYPELNPFLAGRAGFRGIRFNVDTNEFAIAFPSTLKTSEAYFSAVDSQASKTEWKLATQSATERVYVKPSDRYLAATHVERVTVAYSPATFEVTLTLEQVHQRSTSN